MFLEREGPEMDDIKKKRLVLMVKILSIFLHFKAVHFFAFLEKGVVLPLILFHMSIKDAIYMILRAPYCLVK